jgi:hypothetical protein
MTIQHICLVDRKGTLLLSYYFVPATPEQQDKWEARLAEYTRDYWAASFGGDVPLVLGERFILLRGSHDIVFMMTGTEEHDELGLVEPMDFCVTCVKETCDRSLTPDKVLAFHGKVRVCLNEMFFAGTLVHTDVELVLRNAKMKPPKV